MAKAKVGSVLLLIEAKTDKLQSDLNKANRSLKRFEGQAKGVSSTMKTMFKGFLAFKGLDIFKGLLSSSLRFNGEMENAKIALEAITAAGIGWTDTQGKMVTASERMAVIQRDSNAIFEELRGILPETATSLKDLTTLYSLMTPAMNQANVKMEDQVEILKLVTNTASKFGISAQQLSTGIDDLGRGTLKANSELGKLFTGLGITNEGLKTAANLADYLKQKLAETGKAADNMATATNELGDTWDRLKGNLTEDIWNPLKELIKQVNTELGIHGVAASKAMGKAIAQMAKWGMDVMTLLGASVSDLIGLLGLAWNGLGKLGTVAAQAGGHIKGMWEQTKAGFAGWTKDGAKKQKELMASAKAMRNLADATKEARFAELDTDSTAILKGMKDRKDSIYKMRDAFVGYKRVEEEASETTLKLTRVTNKATEGAKKAKGTKKKATGASKAHTKALKAETSATYGYFLAVEKAKEAQQEFNIGIADTLAYGMEDMFMGLTDSAFSFRDTMRSVLNDIARQIFNTFVTSKISGFFSNVLSSMSSSGGDGIEYFAKGGVVNSPTMVGHNQVAGEAGAEAVIPLTRRNGIMGVGGSPVTVNVQNYGNDNVEVQQNGDTYEIIISKLSQEIRRGTGIIGNTLESRYGLRKA